jgi:hypothetical protein
VVRPPYVAVVRLFAYAERYWPAIDGEAASRGADYLALPLDRFCNAVQWWVTQRVKDVDYFERELVRPIGGMVTEQDLEADAESFLAFAAAVGVKPPTAIASADDDTSGLGDDEPSPADEAATA